MNKIIASSILSIFLSSCASTTENSTSNSVEEPIKYVDLSSDEQMEVFNEYWVVTKRQEPQFPLKAAKKSLSGCVELVIGINSDGKMAKYNIKNSYPEGLFDKSAAAALKKWKWSASPKNVDKTPALTTIQLDFMVSGAQNKPEAQKQCGFSHI